MSTDPLHPDLLHLFVFGPGYGESILLRIPPDRWIVVDGCRAGGQAPAAELLKEHGAAWSCLVLTHPHKDHVLGLDEVLAGAGAGPIGCADPMVDDPKRWTRSPDPEDLLIGGAVEQVLAVIHDRWHTEPTTRWLLRRGESRAVGEATLTALHPTDADVALHGGRRPNRLACPLLVSWRGVRILLGSDVVAEDWAAIDAAGQFGDLADHAALKVPHHGSRAAMHASFASPPDLQPRLWIVTPFNQGRKLPRAEDGEGLAWMLSQVDRVHLTGLPVARDLQGAVPLETTRQELRDGVRPTPLATAMPVGPAISLLPETAGDRCRITAAFDGEGRLVWVDHAPGTVIVRDAVARHKRRPAVDYVP